MKISLEYWRSLQFCSQLLLTITQSAKAYRLKKERKSFKEKRILEGVKTYIKTLFHLMYSSYSSDRSGKAGCFID
ncbi:MAG: hypothetical protein WBD47_08085 [Phormidesmis sp.]